MFQKEVLKIDPSKLSENGKDSCNSLTDENHLLCQKFRLVGLLGQTFENRISCHFWPTRNAARLYITIFFLLKFIAVSYDWNKKKQKTTTTTKSVAEIKLQHL